MREYLAQQGIPIDDLRASVEHTQAKSYEQSWADATQEFLNGPFGSDWPGGDQNLEIIGLKLQQLHLEDAEDKVAALAQAYASMKSSKTIFPYVAPVADDLAPTPTSAPVPTPTGAVAPAAAAAAPAAPAATHTATPAAQVAATSSAMFGASSGTGAYSEISPIKREALKIVPPEATPEQILAEWKEQTLKSGKSLDNAFIDTFAARR